MREAKTYLYLLQKRMFPYAHIGARKTPYAPECSRAGQSRLMSVIEAVTGVIVGYGVSMSLTRWLTGVDWTQAAHWSAWFTAASLVRSYGLRRLFARWG